MIAPDTTVWIASDFHGTPLGTFTNPFDGSTAEKFDALMRGFPPNIRIRLLDGVFETSGSANFNSAGWFVKYGWQIIGNGPERTTIKKVFFPPEAIGNSHATLEMEYTSPGGATVQDLCVDENFPDGFDQNYCTFAVHLYGNNCAIRNVWAKNGFGSRANWREAFTLSTCASCIDSVWQNGTGSVIENCQVFGFKGDYGAAISNCGGPDGLTTMECYIRNNIVRGYNSAAFGVGGRGLFEGNLSEQCATDYYGEGAVGTVISGNRMTGTTGFNVHLYPVNGLAMSDILIEGNQIEAAKLAVALSGLDGKLLSNITIRSNTMTGAGDAINAGFVNGLKIENNMVAPQMVSHIDPNCAEVVKVGNKFSGTPIGLENT